MKPDLSRLYPLGWPWQKELRYTGVALGFAALYAFFRFVFPMQQAINQLYQLQGQKRVLIPGAVVPPFPALYQGAAAGFVLVVLCLILLPIFQYRWHYQGSRSIYLMRRLPRRWDLARRCLAGPALELVCTALCALAMLLLCFLWYWLFTPAGHLPEDVWAGIGGLLC